MDDTALAQTMLEQANTYENEVKRLREEAYAMAEVDKQSDGAPSIIVEEVQKERPSLFGRLR